MLLCAALMLLWGAPGLTAARADSTLPASSPPESHDWIIEAGKDATVSPDQIVGGVTTVDGDAIIAGSVRRAVVAVGGDVIVLSGGSVRGPAVAIGGRVVRQPGSVVRGDVVALHTGSLRRAAVRSLVRPIIHPFTEGALVGWAATTILFMVLAALAALLLPRQIAIVRDRLARHFLSSAGWGVLGGGVLVPAVSVVLLLTVVGVAVLIPLLVVIVPLLFLFGFLCLGTLVGGALLRVAGKRGENLVLSSIVGVAVVHLVRLVPIAGTLVWALLWLTGFGATYIAAYASWRERRTAATRGSRP